MDWRVLLNDAGDPRPAIPPDAVAELLAGNARFSGRDGPADLLPPSLPDELVKQAPGCVILGCADALYRVVWSQFDIASGEVRLPGVDGDRLRPAPRMADDLIAVSREIAVGPAVRRHLPT